MRPSPLPPLLASSPFRVGEALTIGLSEKRLRADDLCAPFHGLRSPSPVSAVQERCVALLPALRPGAAFSHVTAAAIWGLPLPLNVPDGDLHVVSAAGDRRRRAGVVVHAQRSDVRGTLAGGLPVVEPLQAWAQCSELLELDDLVAMGDALAGRWSVFDEARERELDELDVALANRRGSRGARRLREARELIRPNVWSPKETELRLAIVRGGLPEPPERNAAVTTDGGDVLGHADLVYRAERLVVEYEGDGHRIDRGRWRRDIGRYESFHDSGWRVLRATSDDLAEPRILLARIARILAKKPVP